MVKKIPTRLETHGHVRVDDYYWLRERDNPEVIRYLNRLADLLFVMARWVNLREGRTEATWPGSRPG